MGDRVETLEMLASGILEEGHTSGSAALAGFAVVLMSTS
jgi:hypothetical protein